jgi:hypothetical protein
MFYIQKCVFNDLISTLGDDGYHNILLQIKELLQWQNKHY